MTDLGLEHDIADEIRDEIITLPTTNAGQVSQAGHQGLWVTRVVSAQNPVLELLPRDRDRTFAYVLAVDAPVLLARTKEDAQAAVAAGAQPVAAGPVQGASSDANGVVTGPTAGQTICSVALGAGTYTVNWIVGLGGTTAGAETDNFQLNLGGTPISGAVAAIGSGSGSENQQMPVTIVVPPGGQTLAVVASVLGTSTAVYRASLTAVPAPATTPATGQVSATGYVPAGVVWPVNHGDTVWAAMLAVATRISVETCRRLDERRQR